MESNTLGRILRENREKQKLSKQKVCRGLCTVMALSRYESDERIPDKFVDGCTFGTAWVSAV